MQRRSFVLGAIGTVGAAWATSGCQPQAPYAHITGGSSNTALQRGHALRDATAWPAPSHTRHVQVLIAGGGVAGLAAARAMQLAGVQDFALLELEDTPGGNSRPGQVGGLACPLGAHYLPVPGDAAREVQDWLEELGLRQRVAGRWRYDDRYLCHSPQERLYQDGTWHKGLLPTHQASASTLAQYRRFAQAVRSAHQAAPFAMPTLTTWEAGGMPAAHRALDAITFAQWLAQQGLDDAHLRWYLDHCCRDDFGAGVARVSAWAGIHYFASRQGFFAPGDAPSDEAEHPAVLTWPEGNGWLTQRLAAPLGDRLHTATSVLRITEARHHVLVDALHHPSGQVVRWQAQRCIVALPVLVARRVVQNPPAFVPAVAQRLATAPWVVSNIHINAPLTDRPGAAPAWDSVLYADPTPGGLGYVNAGHQRLDPRPQPTVLTYYQALGDHPQARQQLAQQPWTHWAHAALTTLAGPHPDLPARATHIEVTRYGHAMAIPEPGLGQFLSQIAPTPHKNKGGALSNGERFRPLPLPTSARVAYAHADWSGYSVLEEAFTRGHTAGGWAAG
jgi:monoamine oxidase